MVASIERVLFHLALIGICGICNVGDARAIQAQVIPNDQSLVIPNAFPATGGPIQTNIGQVLTFGSVQTLRVQSDDKIVLATYRCGGNNPGSCEAALLVRYQKDGLLDSSFGTDGRIKLPFLVANDEWLFVQPDNKVVVAGIVNDLSEIVRYDQTGVPDPTFGVSGTAVITGITGIDSFTLNSIALQPDKKILVIGQVKNGINLASAIIRLTAAGRLDQNFGKLGVQLRDGLDDAVAIRPLDSGKFLVAGRFHAYQYLSNGTFDAQFASQGVYTYPQPTSYPYTYIDSPQLFTQTDTSMLFFHPGWCEDKLFRLTSQGMLDLSLGVDGLVTLSGTQTNHVIVAGENILQMGTSPCYVQASNLHIKRLYLNGDVDVAFGQQGVFSSGLYLSSAATGALQSDGKIIVAGSKFYGTRSTVAMIRLTRDGALDSTFADHGMAVLPDYMDSDDVLSDLLYQPDGKLLVGGSTEIDLGHVAPMVMRYNPDGSLDSTFGDSGVALPLSITVPSNWYVRRFSVNLVRQDNGKLLMAVVGASPQYMFARLDSQGKIDNSFGTNGIVTGTILTTTDGSYVEQMLTQLNQKFLVAASGTGHTSLTDNIDSILMRFDDSGQLDNTFGMTGVVRLSYPFKKMAQDAQGHIYVLGGSRSKPISLQRYTISGTIDTSLGNGGLVTIAQPNFSGSFGYELEPKDLLVYPNGQALIFVDQYANTSKGVFFDGHLIYMISDSGQLTYTTFFSSLSSYQRIQLLHDGSILMSGIGTDCAWIYFNLCFQNRFFPMIALISADLQSTTLPISITTTLVCSSLYCASDAPGTYLAVNLNNEHEFVLGGGVKHQTLQNEPAGPVGIDIGITRYRLVAVAQLTQMLTLPVIFR